MTPREKYRLRSLLLAAVGFIGLGVAGIGVTVWKLRADAIEYAYQSNGDLAVVLAQQTSQTIRSIEVVLKDIQERLNALGASGDDLKSIATVFGHSMLRTQLERSPQTDAISVIGADGRLIVSSRSWPADPLDVSDRDYFKYFTEHPDEETYISGPVINRTTGAPSIFLARRISNSDVSFAGVVVAGVPLASFKDIFAAIGLQGGQAFVFFHKDGTVLLRYPDDQASAGQKLPASSPWYGIIAKGGGTFRSSGTFDDKARLISVRPIPGYPLAVNVGVLETTALEVWRNLAIIIFTGTFVGIVSSAVLLYLLLRQFKQVRRSRMQLAATTQELKVAYSRIDAAISNMAQGVSMFDADQKMILCNARYLEIYGHSADVVKPGCTLAEIMSQAQSPDAAAQNADAYLRNMTSQTDGKTVPYIVKIGDRVISISGRPMPEGGWVAVHEDITDRYHAEERTAHLARHDTLTGLLNRTAFNDKFADAIQRLERLDESFAILLIDLDKFKNVNDTFGHPIGDALLKGSAERLTSCAREIDAVARIGGDEFAILLTHLDEPMSAARVVANRLLDAFSTPFQFGAHQIEMGISIGIALAPRDGTLRELLITHADLALYRAKDEGRNRFRFFEAKLDTSNNEASANLRIA
ncbi:MAG: diguanylate cyclase domain-containing protein [Xanthobacteraceae bacterium]